MVRKTTEVFSTPLSVCSKVAVTDLNPVQIDHFILMNNFTAGKASICLSSENERKYNCEKHLMNEGSKKKLYRSCMKGRYSDSYSE